MGWDLERRKCIMENCPNTFRVLPQSLQRHCSIPHNPNESLRTHRAMEQLAMKKKTEGRLKKREAMIAKVKSLYAEGWTSQEVISELNALGFRKPQKGHPIDTVFLQMLRFKYKIRIPKPTAKD